MSFINRRKKISLHVKTDLNTDGRVLAWIDTLTENYKNIDFCISIYSDRSINLKFPVNVKINEIKVYFKSINNSFFSILRLLNYAFKDFLFLIKFQPSVMIVQDKNALLAPMLYKIFVSKSSLIYDDHELFNFPLTLEDKLFFIIEKLSYKISNNVVVANKYRKKIISRLYNTDREIFILQNYYHDRFNSKNLDLSVNTKKAIDVICELKTQNKILVLHQGRITKQRGEDKILELLSTLDDKYHFCFIGDETYDFGLISSRNNFTVLGKIPYSELKIIYKEINITVIFYEDKYINNRYCAPNRLFMSMYFNMFIITNNNISMVDSLKNYNKKMVYSKNNMNLNFNTPNINIINKEYGFIFNNSKLINSLISKNL